VIRVRHSGDPIPPSIFALRGPGRSSASHVLRALARDPFAAGRLVCVPGEADVEPTRVVVWSGLDGALPDDGGCSLARMDAPGLEYFLVDLSGATAAQRRVDADLFWCPGNRLGLCRDSRALDCDPVHGVGFPASQQGRRMDAGAIPCVGLIRRLPQLHVVALESGLRSTGSPG
jgi:hypothetical protein